MAQKFLSIKNFEKYQHYKKRMPPWVKVYRSMLGDPAFMKLTPTMKYVYIGLIILASEGDNRVVNDRSFIAHRLCIQESEIDLNALYRSGFLLASDASIRRYHQTETETETESSLKKEKQRQSFALKKEQTETETENSSAGVRNGRAAVPAKRSSNSSETWEAYAGAYRHRYGADPVRNAKVNGQLAHFVTRLPLAEAPLVAAFYLTHNKPIYVSSRHCTDLLLRDAEGLHTEWVTGVKATSGESRNAERRDDAIAQIERVRKAMQGGG